LKKHKTSKKELRLQKYGYFAKKGQFGYVKKNVSLKKRGTKKRRGGESNTEIPSNFDESRVQEDANMEQPVNV
jgi:hypothetical protein